MIYVRAISKTTKYADTGAYPFSAPVLRGMDRLEFSSPITFIAGDNGSGKTTLMEILAQKLAAIRIDSDLADTLPKVKSFSGIDQAFRTEMALKPKRCFFFHAEGFIRYTDSIHSMRQTAREELKNVESEYRDRSDYARGQATMPHARALYEMQNMYGKDITARSHGEGFLDFYGARIADGGLYLLDEPESALSFFNQYVLLNMIADASMKNCQWIISTHSPVLLACPNCCIYEIVDGKIQKTEYRQLDNIRFIASFLADTQRYTRTLFSEEP